MANSRRRDAARASCRLATLATEAASSKPTAASRTSSAGRTSLVASSRAGTSVIWAGPSLPKTAMATGPALGAAWARAEASAVACATVAPGLSRAIALNILMLPLREPGVTVGGTWKGSQIAVSRFGKVKSAPITPTTVNGSPSRRSASPSTSRRPSSRCCQKACDTSTTRPAPSGVSESRKRRPSRGAARKTSNRLGDTPADRTRSARPSPVSVNSLSAHAPMASMVVALSCQAR